MEHEEEGSKIFSVGKSFDNFSRFWKKGEVIQRKEFCRSVN